MATRLRIWRWLHAVVEADLRAVYGDMTLVVGEDAAERRYPSSHWRPGFSLGLEVSL